MNGKLVSRSAAAPANGRPRGQGVADGRTAGCGPRYRGDRHVAASVTRACPSAPQKGVLIKGRGAHLRNATHLRGLSVGFPEFSKTLPPPDGKASSVNLSIRLSGKQTKCQCSQNGGSPAILGQMASCKWLPGWRAIMTRLMPSLTPPI